MVTKGALWIATIFTGFIFGTAVWFFLMFHISAPVILQECDATGVTIQGLEVLVRIILIASIALLPLYSRRTIANFVKTKWPKYDTPFNTQSLIDVVVAFTVFIGLFFLVEQYYLNDAVMNYFTGIEVDRGALNSCWMQGI